MKDQLLKKASEKLETLNALKNLAVNLGDYELASKCRELELELYPISVAEKEAKKLGKQLNGLFRMVDLDINPETCFKIYKTIEKFQEKNDKFDMKDAAKISVASETFFARG